MIFQFSLQACSINSTLSSYTLKEQRSICFEELYHELIGKKYKTMKIQPPNSVDKNKIQLQLSIDKVVYMDQKEEITGILGQMVARWQDWRLTWDPAEWAGIEMFQISADEIWKPDLIMQNDRNSSNRNFTVGDKHQVRVWADRASMNDIEGEKFNIEWSPTISLELFHQYDNFQYPLDLQTVIIEIHPWMSIDGYGQNSLQLLSDAASMSTSQNPITFSEFVRDEDRFILIEGSSKSWIQSQMWNDMEFNIMFASFQLQRQDYKFFSVIQFPLILLLTMSTFNIIFCTKDSRVRNSVTLLVSSSVYQTIFYQIVQHNTKFGLFEIMLQTNNFTTFTSNIITIVEYYYEVEYDLITGLASEFYDKGRIQNDDTISNKVRYSYKKIFSLLRKIDVMLNITVISVNIIVIGTQFKNIIQRQTQQTIILTLLILILLQVQRNINSLYISQMIYKIQQVHRKNSDKIEEKLIKQQREFEESSLNKVEDYISKIQDPYFFNKDKENLSHVISYMVRIFDEFNNNCLNRDQLALLITGLSCDLKDLEADNLKYTNFYKMLENENKIQTQSRSNTNQISFLDSTKNQENNIQSKNSLMQSEKQQRNDDKIQIFEVI